VRIERGGAVRAHHSEVLDPVVVRSAVDVVEHQRHPPTVPMLVLTAELTARFQETGIEQASFEVETVVRRVLDQYTLERDLHRARCPSTTEVRVEMIGVDAPTPCPLLERPIVPTPDGIAEVSKRISPTDRAGYRRPSVGFREWMRPGIREHMFPCGSDGNSRHLQVLCRRTQ
jgi:hypothetical protein